MTLQDPLSDAVIKLVAAVVLSTPLGLERERKERPAGLRTHVLVCLGATLMLIVSEHLSLDALGEGARLDRARVAAGVVTGIGFLGAGTIFTVGANQRGLTTAAMIWFVAALGVAIGVGYITVAAVATVVALLVVMGFEYLERILPAPERPYRLTVHMPDGVQELGNLEHYIREQDFRVDVSEVRLGKGGKDAEVVFSITSHGAANITTLAKMISERYDHVEKTVLDR